MYDLNHDYLEDERVNLNIQLPQPIICIADLGRWNGRFSGYKEIASGNIRDGTTESQRDALKQKIYDNRATRADITRVTRRLGDEIAKVYGFKIPKRNKGLER